MMFSFPCRSLFGILGIMALCFGACTKRGNKKLQNPMTVDISTSSQESAPAIKLKGANLLAQSLYRTLGPNKDLQVERDRRGNAVRLFELYSQNFGNTDGLRFGEIYPDSPSAGYFLALAIVGDNAARQCQAELSKDEIQSLCRCSTMNDAQAMLDRALPQAGFNQGAHADLTRRFLERCQQDYIGAVSSLVSSLAFAVRQ